MPSSKELRRRIKSIRSTRQITKAMELVAAAKMRKAQNAALASRTYAKLAWDLIQSVSTKAHPAIHKLLRQPEEVKNIGILLITSNRGLIGGFNNSIIGKALEYTQEAIHDLSSNLSPSPGERSNQFGRVEFVTIGKKGRDAVRKRGFTIAADFEKKDILAGAEEFLPVARLVITDFIKGNYDKVILVYMDFISTLRQEPHVRELLPLVQTADKTLGAVDDLSSNLSPSPGERSKSLEPPTPRDGEGSRDRSIRDTKHLIHDTDYLFEPSPDLVLEVLLPRLTEMQIYQAYLETDAAEHSARMVAMKNASDAAGDLIDELNLEFNQARQAAITTEISEIVAGKLALTN